MGKVYAQNLGLLSVAFSLLGFLPYSPESLIVLSFFLGTANQSEGGLSTNVWATARRSVAALRARR